MELRPLRLGDEAAFFSAIEAFRRDDPTWAFAFEMASYKDWPSYVAMVNSWPRGENLPANFVPNTFLVGIVDGEIVGRVSLRHELSDWLRRIGGHIGYGVVPDHRRHGYATEMLRMTLPLARDLGLVRILVTCDDDNAGSIKTIEKNGGVLEEKIREDGMNCAKRRYWIEL
jgi:predicted acetyltransferase